MGLLCLGLVVTAVVQNHYKDPVTFIGGAVSLFFALLLFLVSFSKTASQSSGRNPFVTYILWVIVVLLGIWTLLGLRNALAAFF